MFDSTSRYADQATEVYVGADGVAVNYVTRRNVPRPIAERDGVQFHEVASDDRLDRVAWQTIGDPTQWWRICDANGALHPDDVLRRAGRRLVVDRLGRGGST